MMSHFIVSQLNHVSEIIQIKFLWLSNLRIQKANHPQITWLLRDRTKQTNNGGLFSILEMKTIVCWLKILSWKSNFVFTIFLKEAIWFLTKKFFQYWKETMKTILAHKKFLCWECLYFHNLNWIFFVTENCKKRTRAERYQFQSNFVKLRKYICKIGKQLR